MHTILQNEDRFVAEIAVLYPIHTMQGDHRFDGPLDPYRGGVEIPYLDYVQLGQMLTDGLGRDFEWLHPEVLADRCTAVSYTHLHKNRRQDRARERKRVA